MKYLKAALALCVVSVATCPGWCQSAEPAENGKRQRLRLERHETFRDEVLVPVENNTDEPLHIEGVQSTSGFFVREYPKVIRPGKSANVVGIYVAREGTSNGADVVRLLTSRGEMTIVVEHDREQVVSLDKRRLVWKAGDTDAKSVEITVVDEATIPMAARVGGDAATATLQRVRPGVYRVTVTPIAGAEPQQFPVFIDFNPALPGVAASIDCYVGIKPPTN